jgi:hypothetical protein
MKVGFKFIHCLTLSATTRKRRNFCPKTAFISLMNHSSYFHRRHFKPKRGTGKNGHWENEERGYRRWEIGDL